MKTIQTIIITICFLLLSALSVSAQGNISRWQDITQAITLDNVEDVVPAIIFHGYRFPVISPDGRYLAMRYGDNLITLFDTITGINRSYTADLSRLNNESSLHHFSADSSMLVFKVSPNAIRLVTTEDGSSRDVFFRSANGGRIVTLSADGNAAFIDATYYSHRNGFRFHTFWVSLNTDESISSRDVIIAQSDDGHYGYQNNNVLTDLETGESILGIATLIPHLTYQRQQVFFAGNYLAVSTNSRNDDEQGVYVIDLDTLEIAYELDDYFIIKGYDAESNQLYISRDYNSQHKIFFLRMDADGFALHHHELPSGSIPGVSPDLTMGITTSDTSISFSDISIIVHEEIVHEIHMSHFYRPSRTQGSRPHIYWSSDRRYVVITTASGTVLYALNQWDEWSLPTVYGATPETRNHRVEPENIQTTTCDNGLASTVMAGQVVYVATSVEFGSSLELNVRSEPQGEALTQVISGEGLIVVAEPVCHSDGFIWLGVQSLRDPSKNGWIIEAQDEEQYIYPLS